MDHPADFSSDVFPEVLATGMAMLWLRHGGLLGRCRGSRTPIYGLSEDILMERVGVDIDGFPQSNGVWVGEGSEIDPTAVIEKPVFIMARTAVLANKRTLDHLFAVLGANVRVGKGVLIAAFVVL